MWYEISIDGRTYLGPGNKEIVRTLTALNNS